MRVSPPLGWRTAAECSSASLRFRGVGRLGSPEAGVRDPPRSGALAVRSGARAAEPSGAGKGSAPAGWRMAGGCGGSGRYSRSKEKVILCFGGGGGGSRSERAIPAVPAASHSPRSAAFTGGRRSCSRARPPARAAGTRATCWGIVPGFRTSPACGWARGRACSTACHPMHRPGGGAPAAGAGAGAGWPVAAAGPHNPALVCVLRLAPHTAMNTRSRSRTPIGSVIAASTVPSTKREEAPWRAKHRPTRRWLSVAAAVSNASVPSRPRGCVSVCH